MSFVYFFISHSALSCRFNEIFDGVVLAYDVDIPSKDAKILPGIHAYFGVRLKAKLLLFSPKPNMLLGSISIILHFIYLFIIFLIG